MMYDGWLWKQVYLHDNDTIYIFSNDTHPWVWEYTCHKHTSKQFWYQQTSNTCSFLREAVPISGIQQQGFFIQDSWVWCSFTTALSEPIMIYAAPALCYCTYCIFMRQRHFKKLPLISRKFLMWSMHQWTSMQSYRHADISQKMKNPNCMLYFVNTNIYLMALWEHGITNPTILNLRKVPSHIIADLSLFQKYMSTL